MIATVAIGCFVAVAGFRAPVEKPVENGQGGLWIEAESFADYGSWEVDTQFTHKMGSAYLICPGADRPTTKPARTEVTIPRAGTWRAWARTKDWLPEFSPGTFALEVNGRRGTTLGASKSEPAISSSQRGTRSWRSATSRARTRGATRSC